MSRSVIHGHTCCECGKLRGCLKRDCAIRGNAKLETEYFCGCEASAPAPLPSIRDVREASESTRELVGAR